MAKAVARRLPFGAEWSGDGTAHFRVWSTVARSIEVVIATESVERRVPLQSEGDGFFEGVVEEVAPGTRYGFALDGGAVRPDPGPRRGTPTSRR